MQAIESGGAVKVSLTRFATEASGAEITDEDLLSRGQVWRDANVVVM